MIETPPVAAPPPEPKQKPKAGADDSLIDTSKMSAGQRAALELTEAAREAAEEVSLASGLFMGSFNPRRHFLCKAPKTVTRAMRSCKNSRRCCVTKSILMKSIAREKFRNP